MPRKRSSESFADSPDFVTSLARGIDIIKAFALAEGETNFSGNMRPADALTLSEVAERTGFARAVVRWFLYTLVELKYVVTDGKYFRLTPKILDLGYAYLSSFSLPRSLRDRSGR
jgi:IclR family pca regulon transcriptional regulator